MSSRFFMGKKLRRKIEKDIKKRSKIENEIIKDLEEFNNQVDEKTILSIINYIKENGNKKQKKALIAIEKRYNKSKLCIEDTLNLCDWYEKMCDAEIEKEKD